MTGTGPLIEVSGVSKTYGGLRPLRVKRFEVNGRDRVALGGLDAAAAETLVHLITGASVPDEGTVRVAGQDTRDIATDTEWLASLDRFGIVTHRAVLIQSLPIDQNLALPLTLSIDPMSADIRAAVEALADAVELPRARLAMPASTLSPAELIRVHLARALASKPRMLLLEHPTGTITDPPTSRAFGRVLHGVAEATGVGWLAITDDAEFVQASRATAFRLKPATGDVAADGGWWKRVLG